MASTETVPGSEWEFRYKVLSRLYCGYENNTAETTAAQDEWSAFPYPSSGYTTWRVHEFTVDPSTSAFTYTGASPAWFKLSATCNIYKGSGGGASRNVEFQWRLNGVPAGPIRGAHMNGADSNIVSGGGQLYLSPGDVVSPYIRNIENGDKILLKNCQFDIVEEPRSTWH